MRRGAAILGAVVPLARRLELPESVAHATRMNDTVKDIVRRFRLTPHPEGGFYREVYRSSVTVEHPGVPRGLDSRRCSASLIHYLLADGQFSAFHRVRWTDEIWHLYAGGPLELHLITAAGEHTRHVLTTDLRSGEPTAVVAAGCWQAVRLAPGAAWAFSGCTVAPGFEFSEFEMPLREELLAAHPAHASIIEALTRR
jgi:uncharacterized protein